jgi:hypothetical protein
MSENLYYYLEKYSVPRKYQKTAAQATKEWLESRKHWFGDDSAIQLLLSETPFSVNVKGGKGT